MRQFGKEIYDHRKFEFEIATGEAAAGTLLASKLPPPNVNHPDGRVVLRQNSVRHQVIDLAGLIQRRFRLDGHPPAPPASTHPLLFRRPPPAPSFAPRPAPATRRLPAKRG